MDIRKLLLENLFALESVLRDMAIWEETMPSEEAMASQLPFAIDTLALNQWLQWMFIPKLTLMITEEMPLPKSCGIGPIAKQWCQLEGLNAAPLLGVLKRFDELLVGECGHYSQ